GGAPRARAGAGGATGAGSRQELQVRDPGAGGTSGVRPVRRGEALADVPALPGAAPARGVRLERRPDPAAVPRRALAPEPRAGDVTAAAAAEARRRRSPRRPRSPSTEEEIRMT